jgi:uncharacterized protein related to proFAR isomerase
MKLIPAISIMSGRVVEVEGGQYRFHKNVEGKFRSPSNILQELESDIVFILDIDGIEANRPDLNLITKMSNHKELWVDAGSLTSGGAADVLISGAAMVVMGTKSILNLDHLEEAVELSENVMFSLDYDGGIITGDKATASMTVDKLLAKVHELGIRKTLLFDLGGLRDGRPPDIELVKKLAGKFDECYVAGNIMPVNVAELESMGATGAMIEFWSLGGFDVE